MANKLVEIDGIGEVTLVKRKGSRHVRISFARDGSVKVSLPYWAPYSTAINFVKSKEDWIDKHRPDQTHTVLSEGDRIGKAHRIRFSPSEIAQKSSVRTSQGNITVSYPSANKTATKSVQKTAERGALKALKAEADQLLPQRLQALALKNSFTYKSLSTKRLSSRWGSCDGQKNIVLNTYLMQLPWSLIDYVIIHELAHTEHLNHSSGFWSRVEQVMPDAKTRRRELKQYKTLVFAVK